jgi:short-subunit dehydrogenase involved in D-alanine esterification of teichoic acids
VWSHPGPDVAIVTGGSTNAGRRLVRALTSQDIAVVVVYLDDQGAAEAVVEDVLAAGDTAAAVRADVTDDLDVERLFQETTTFFGAVDVVVHAATLDPSLVNRQAVEHLRRGGTIINISPTAAISPELLQRAQEHDITLGDVAIPTEPSAGDRDLVADLVALLERRGSQGEDQGTPGRDQ